MDVVSFNKTNDLGLKILRYTIFLSAIMLFALSATSLTFFDLHNVFIFALVSFLSLLMPTRLPHGTDYSVAFIIDLVIIALYGFPFAVATRFIVNIAAVLVLNLLQRNEPSRMALTIGQAVVVTGLAAKAYEFLGNEVWAFIGISVVYFTASTFFIALDAVMSGTETGFFRQWASVVRLLYLNFFVLSSLAYLLTYVVKNAGSEWRLLGVLLFFVPVMLVSHAFKLSVNIKQSYLNTVRTIAAAIEAKDPYMKGHSSRVAELTVAIGTHFKISEKELQKLEYIALLHDVGKIGISDEILGKPTPLTEEEYEGVRKHSALGADILSKIQFLSTKAPVVLHHHEWYDGSGYPEGLAGEDIPLEARILAVSDAYDAMTTQRPYRPAKSPFQAAQEMTNLAGIQFDPAVVEVLVNILRRRGEI